MKENHGTQSSDVSGFWSLFAAWMLKEMLSHHAVDASLFFALLYKTTTLALIQISPILNSIALITHYLTGVFDY